MPGNVSTDIKLSKFSKSYYMYVQSIQVRVSPHSLNVMNSCQVQGFAWIAGNFSLSWNR